MVVNDIERDVQFTLDPQGTITAVVLSPAVWQQIVAALEDVEDRSLVQALHTRLAAHPTASGALRWRDVADTWA